MKTEDFSFDLPDELIAQTPAEPRDACRLMVLKRSSHGIEHHFFHDLPKFLRAGDVLVMNDSRVLPARMFFDSGKRKAELFLLRKSQENSWFCIGKPGKILQPGKIFIIAPDFTFEVKKVLADGQRLVLFHNKNQNLDDLIEKFGHTPLPPYIRGSRSKPDDYQTVYAERTGSVAAPTAGLHFTARILSELASMGVESVFVTLHVGLGTFLPIQSEDVETHTMHSEFFELNPQAAAQLQKAHLEGRRIIAVGTTSVRVLESSFLPERGFVPQVGETSIYIYPGYQWKCVSGLITNFHLPQSTLLLLTCSFAGRDFVLEAYREAVRLKYRFYSFGDAMLIL